jgi:hypothetical protein
LKTDKLQSDLCELDFQPAHDKHRLANAAAKQKGGKDENKEKGQSN